MTVELTYTPREGIQDLPASVVVTGNFDGWTQSVRMEYCSERRVFAGMVEPGESEQLVFKFVVDGEWTTSAQYKVERDSSGNRNNVALASALLPRPASGLAGAGAGAGAGAPAAAARRCHEDPVHGARVADKGQQQTGAEEPGDSPPVHAWPLQNIPTVCVGNTTTEDNQTLPGHNQDKLEEVVLDVADLKLVDVQDNLSAELPTPAKTTTTATELDAIIPVEVVVRTASITSNEVTTTAASQTATTPLTSSPENGSSPTLRKRVSLFAKKGSVATATFTVAASKAAAVAAESSTDKPSLFKKLSFGNNKKESEADAPNSTVPPPVSPIRGSKFSLRELFKRKGSSSTAA